MAIPQPTFVEYFNQQMGASHSIQYDRATPNNYLLYKHALWSYKLMNENPTHTFECTALNANITFTSRQTTFINSVLAISIYQYTESISM